MRPGLLGTGVRAVLAALLLAGCAAQQAHKEGVALMAAGRPEEGLAKLTEASQADPANLAYRADLMRNREQTVNRMLAAASSERAAGRPGTAQALYERIILIDPGNSRGLGGLELLRMDARHDEAVTRAEKLLKQRDLEGARAAIKPVLVENPKNAKALTLQARIDEQAAKDAQAEPSLGTKFSKPITLQFRDANLKMVFEALSRTAGINVLLDRDVKPDLKTSIFVKDVSVEDTINLILLQNQLEKKVLSDNTVFIFPATPAKLKEYQDLKIRSFHLKNADPKQILTMIKTLLKTKDVFIHERTNSIVMRDTADAIRLAEKMVADQDMAQPEVMLEVEVLEVSTSRLSELGIRWPGSVSLSTPPAADTLGAMRNLTSNDLLISPLSATLNLRLEDGDANLLASPRIRVRNREKARVMIGSRVPVITNAVTPVATGAPVVTGSVQYLDVGLKLEVETDINHQDEVVIKVGLDVSSIIREVPNVQSGTLAYEIGTRNAATVLRLRDGETQVLAGLISDEERRAAAKVPGLGQLPVLGALFGSRRDTGAKSEIVLSITPRIVGSARLPELSEIEYWSGTDATVRSGPFSFRPMGTVTVAGPSGTQATAPAAAPPARGGTRRPPLTAGSQAAAPGAASPVVLSWQGPAEVKPGDHVRLTLGVNAVQPVGRLDLQVSFDPTVLRAVDVAEGSFVQQTPFVLSKTINQDAGQILLDLSGRGPEGGKGAGSLVTLEFQAIAPSPGAHIAISRVAPSAPGGESLEATLPEPHLLRVTP
jgi:general secretion pathway protein D